MTTRTINSARNPKWVDEANTAIDLEVDFDELDEAYVPFTAAQYDAETWGRTLYQNAINGDYGAIAAWQTPPNMTGDDAMQEVRARRNALLAETDYIEIPTKWATLTTAKQAEWTTYRNSLRDLPSTYPSAEFRWSSADNDYILFNLTWPTKPD